ncbi:MAG: PLD nuclease N-terminal domain-containing protein, partial [Saccharofermentanaceae bacterium]|nr:PLD nuclease N-terminal domain-containing protein [Saccharofermentanaceae bacterium]
MRKQWFQSLLMRRAVIILILLVEISSFIFLIVAGTTISEVAAIIFRVLSIVVALYVVSKNDKGGYRLIWVFLILMFPVFGGVLYVFINSQMISDRYAKNLDEVIRSTQDQLTIDPALNNELKEKFPVYVKSV